MVRMFAVLGLIGLLFGLGAVEGGAQAVPRTVMVVDFANRSGGWPGTSDAVTDRVIAKFRENQSVRVLSRDEVRKALQQANVETSGLLDPHDVQNLARALGADYVIMGEVTAFGQEVNGGCLPFSFCEYTTTATVAFHGKVLEVPAGQFVANPRGDAKTSRASGWDYGEPWWRIVSIDNFDSQLVGQATLEAVDKFVGQAMPYLN